MQAFRTLLTGEVQGGTTAAQLPDVPCSMVKIRAVSSNSTNVYIGGAGITIPDGATDTTTGYELDAGQETDWLYIDNLNKLWMISDANADDIVYLAFK